jgi:hypothetical protein
MEHLPEVLFILVRLFLLVCLGLGLGRVVTWLWARLRRGMGGRR